MNRRRSVNISLALCLLCLRNGIRRLVLLLNLWQTIRTPLIDRKREKLIYLPWLKAVTVSLL